MDPLNIEGLPANALVLVDTAPIIYVLEGHSRFAERFRPLFESHEAGALQLAVTTVTIAEVISGEGFWTSALTLVADARMRLAAGARKPPR